MNYMYNLVFKRRKKIIYIQVNNPKQMYSTSENRNRNISSKNVKMRL